VRLQERVSTRRGRDALVKRRVGTSTAVKPEIGRGLSSRPRDERRVDAGGGAPHSSSCAPDKPGFGDTLVVTCAPHGGDPPPATVRSRVVVSARLTVSVALRDDECLKTALYWVRLAEPIGATPILDPALRILYFIDRCHHAVDVNPSPCTHQTRHNCHINLANAPSRRVLPPVFRTPSIK
jgi:hypothetical protein